MEEEKVEKHAEDARSRGSGRESRERGGGSIEEGIGEAGGEPSRCRFDWMTDSLFSLSISFFKSC